MAIIYRPDSIFTADRLVEIAKRYLPPEYEPAARIAYLKPHTKDLVFYLKAQVLGDPQPYTVDQLLRIVRHTLPFITMGQHEDDVRAGPQLGTHDLLYYLAKHIEGKTI